MSRNRQLLLFGIAFLTPLSALLIALFVPAGNSDFAENQYYFRLLLQDKDITKSIINTYLEPLFTVILAVVALGYIQRVLHKKGTKSFLLQFFYPFSFLVLCAVWHIVSIIHDIHTQLWLQQIDNDGSFGTLSFRYIFNTIIMSFPRGYMGVSLYFTLIRLMLFVGFVFLLWWFHNRKKPIK